MAPVPRIAGSADRAAFFATLILALAAVAQPAGPEQLIQAGHWKRARAVVDARYRESPDDPLANFLLSQIRFAFGDHLTPLALAEKAVARDGQVAKYHRQLAEVLGVQAQHAGALQQVFLARRFRKEIDAALSLEPRDVQALRDLLEYYLVAPALVGGDPAKAASLADRIGGIDAPEGFLAKARVALFHKRPADAASFLREASRAQPASYRARIELARFDLEMEHPDQDSAELAAKSALDLDRGRAEAYVILAGIYADRGDWPALDAILHDASQQDPDDLAACYHAADHLLGAGRDPARAERYLRAYLGQEPEGNEPRAPEAHWKLGLALEAQGKQGEAVAEWKHSLRLDPASPASRDLKRLRVLGAATRFLPLCVQC